MTTIDITVPEILRRTETGVLIKVWRRNGEALETNKIWVATKCIFEERDVPGGIFMRVWVKRAEALGLCPSAATPPHLVWKAGPLPPARPVAEIEQLITARQAEREVLKHKFEQALADGVVRLVDLARRVEEADIHTAGLTAPVLIGAVVELMLPLKPLQTELRASRKADTLAVELDKTTGKQLDARIARDAEPRQMALLVV